MREYYSSEKNKGEIKMEDEGRELTEEELEELQKDIAYCNATSMPQTKNEGYYSETYLRLNPYYDSDYAKIVFVIGDVFTFFYPLLSYSAVCLEKYM